MIFYYLFVSGIYNLCRISIFLHDIDYNKFNIVHKDTFIEPQHWGDESFEVNCIKSALFY